jgi:hypothetical protein
MSRSTLRQTSAVVAAGVLLATGLAACSSTTSSGGSSSSAAPASSAASTRNDIASQSADQILSATKAAATAATSVKVSSEVEQGSQKQSFELTLTKDGAQGTMSQGTGSFELIATPQTIYIKGDSAFNSTFAGEAAKLLEGKWLAIPADGAQAQSFSTMASSTAFFEGLLTSDRTLSKTSETKDIAGVPCIGLSDEGKGTLWVATTGEPLPMAIDPPAGQKGYLTFTEWNAPVTIQAPPAEEVVDVSKLPSAAATP